MASLSSSHAKSNPKSSPTMPSSTTTSSTSTWLLFLNGMIIALGMFNFGYYLAQLNALKPAFTCSFPANPLLPLPWINYPSCLPLTDLEYNFAQAILPLGGIVGALLMSHVIEVLGRKKTLALIGVPFIVSSLVLFFVDSFHGLLIGRFIAGIATGGSCAVDPLYINEIAPKELRGKLGTLSAFFLTLGLFIASLISYFAAATVYWRLILGFPLITTLLQLACIPFLLPSPMDTQEDPSSSSSPPPSRTPLLQFLTQKAYRPSLLILILCQGLQQLSGINVYFAYSLSIVTPILPTSANVFGLVVSFFYILFNFIPGALLEKWGRRPLLIFSAFSMGASAALITLFDHTFAYLALVMFILTLLTFTLGLSVIPFLYTAEVVPPSAISAASSVAYVVNNVSSFIVLMITPIALSGLGSYAFLIFTGILWIGGCLMYLCVPETKGKTSNEVVQQLQRRFPIRTIWGRKTTPHEESQRAEASPSQV
ncbi:hypothetical protein HMI54_004446 [Coelomomyces lativittatus]|nr:hypothetical protein HMI54_004446 [Coelomomyces lativittatus]KAJ1515460.1 hypothetical protein HMI56_004546 [Coelomomyces lativittatus]KAJ1516250.1 hypothetical protein HMI55_002692 [Coelomomyces lativittatus]